VVWTCLRPVGDLNGSPSDPGDPPVLSDRSTSHVQLAIRGAKGAPVPIDRRPMPSGRGLPL